MARRLCLQDPPQSLLDDTMEDPRRWPWQ
jgi:hypothetical protein